MLHIRKQLVSAFFILSIITPLLLTSCSAVGYMVGGSIDQFTGHNIINLDTTRTDIFDLITQVGNEMDLKVSGMDREKQQIALSSGSSIATSSLIGKSSYTLISISVTNSGKTLDVSIFVQGNFSYGTKENADKIFNEFKGKLLSKIK